MTLFRNVNLKSRKYSLISLSVDKKSPQKQLHENVMKLLFLCCALMSATAILIICLFLFANGIPAISEIGLSEFLLGMRWKPSMDLYGIFPMIVGSIYVTAGAAVVGVPIGILTAVYMAFYCHKKIYAFIKPAVDLLAGIPSIIYGFFGLTVIVPFMQKVLGTGGKGVLTSSILLGIMILPTIISTTETALRAVPSAYLEGSLALGAAKERSIFKAVLPAAKSGILSGVILGIGRAIGETMAVVMIAGNQAVVPKSITSGVRTLTSNIVLEMGYAAELHRDALIATAVVLFGFILFINLCFSAIKYGGRKK